jgi:integrase
MPRNAMAGAGGKQKRRATFKRIVDSQKPMSVASFINAGTGNLKITQKFLGHSNVSTTADIYTHISEAMEREAAVFFGEIDFWKSVRDFDRKSISVPN